MESLFANRPEYGKGYWWRAVVFSVATGFAFLETTHLLTGAFLTKEQEDAHGSQLVLASWGAFLLPMTIALLVTIAMSFSRRKRAADLFGSGPGEKAEGEKSGREIRIVVSSYLHAKPYNGDVKDRYYKSDKDGPDSKRFVRGSEEAVVGLLTMRSAIFAAEQAQKLGRFRVAVAGDTDAAPVYAATYVCLGSPGTNDVARFVFQQKGLNSALPLYRFDEKGNLRGGEPPETLEADRTGDHAVITKLSSGANIHFVCAGIDEEGTIAAVSYLLTGWQDLWKKVGTKDFHLALDVQKNQVPKIEACKLRGKIWVKQATEDYFNPLPA